MNGERVETVVIHPEGDDSFTRLYERLEQAFDLADIPRSLIDPSLRFLRSFLDAAEGKNRGDLALETTLAAEILPLILSAADLIREPLTRTRREAAPRS